MAHECPWKVSDAPDRYVELLRKNIIGIEITIDRRARSCRRAIGRVSSAGSRPWGPTLAVGCRPL
jgi:hypothetical protein